MLLRSARDEACAPSTLNVGQTAAFFSVLGPSTGPSLSAVQLSFCRRKEGSVACPFHGLHSGCPSPSPLAWTQSPPFLPELPLQGPQCGARFSVLHQSSLHFLVLRLPAITALSGQPGWMRLSDLGGRLAGAGFLVLRPARDPGQRCRLPLTCAQGWFFSNEGQSLQHGNRL